MKIIDKNAFHLALRNTFHMLVFQHGCDDIFDIEDLNFILNKTTCDIEDSLNTVASIITKTSRIVWKQKPWISKNILFEIKEPDRAFSIAKNSNLNEDKVNYKELRNEIVNMIKNSKRLHNEQCIDNNKSKPDKLWKNSKELIGDKRKGNLDALNKINFNGEICRDVNIFANKLNDYFVKNVKKIVDDIGNGEGQVREEEINNNVKWDSFDEVTEEQIDKIVRNLDCKTKCLLAPSTEKSVTLISTIETRTFLKKWAE